MKTSILLQRTYRAIHATFFIFQQITMWFLYAMYMLSICFLYPLYMLSIWWLWCDMLIQIVTLMSYDWITLMG